MITDRRLNVTASDGTSLAVREIGSRTAPITVVFAHGFSLNMESWAPQQTHLATRWRDRARMVFLDHRGHGRSGSAHPDSYTISQLGHDLTVVIEAVAPTGPIVLVGHSMGGMAVLSYIAEQPNAAARVAGIGLVSTAINGVAGAGIGRALNTPALAALTAACTNSPRLLQTCWSLSRQLLGPIVSPPGRMRAYPAIRAAATSCKMVQATPIATVSAFLRELREYDAMPALPVLAGTPATVICGTHDLITPITHSRRLAAALPLAELVAVPGAGHMIQLERPGVVTGGLDRLLRRAEQAVLMPNQPSRSAARRRPTRAAS